MERVYSFSSSPAALPTEVLEEAARALTDYNGSGLSVMEIGKASKEYWEIYRSAEQLLRELMNIPQGYKVMFMSGGSDMQYSAIPLNLLSDHKCADYVITGRLSKNAHLEAKKYGDIAIAASSAGASPAFSTVPYTEQKHFRPDADYVYICFNNTVYGTKYSYIPDTVLLKPVDVSKFALIYANAESCLGIGGLTVVIVRDDLAAGAMDKTPTPLDYKSFISGAGEDITPAPVWSVYMARLVFEWIRNMGGLEEVKRRNERKASYIYDYLDSQTYYTAPVDKNCRSLLNVVFVTGDNSLDKRFAKQAAEIGLANLSGHSSVGGMCASLYNAMPAEGVERLVAFMKKFAQENPKLDA